MFLENQFESLWVCSAIAAAAAMAWLIVWLLIRRKAPNRSASGGTSKAGPFLLDKLDLLTAQVQILTAALFGVPVALYAVFITVSHFGLAATGTVLEPAALFLCIVLFSAGTINRLSAIRLQRKATRLKCESRLITAGALNDIAYQGYVVFHDLVIGPDQFDHIAVGSRGIFVIASGTESPVAIPEAGSSHMVTYDGRALVFPRGEDHVGLQTAVLLAERLSEKLSELLNEQVAARAILSLPGWTVRRTASEGISVVNPRQFASLFEYIQPRFLDPDAVQYIARLILQLSAGNISEEPAQGGDSALDQKVVKSAER